MSWKETEHSWIDELSGLEWEKEFKTNISQYDAEQWAKEKGKRLPTQEEFMEAEKHGIRELQNMDWEGYWFWSSTAYPGNSDYAYVFYGYNGYAAAYYNRSYSYYNVAARAVSEVQKDEILVDDCDKDLLVQCKWYPTQFRNTKYAQTHNGVRLHRTILERKLGRPLEEGELVDHENRNGLDNRRDNLRLSNHSENALNTDLDRTGMTSQYRGVYKQGKRWIARFGKSRIYLGSYETEQEAYEAREHFLSLEAVVSPVGSPSVDSKLDSSAERILRAKDLLKQVLELLE